MPVSVKDTTPPLEKPQIRQAGSYEVVEGATQAQGMDVSFDKGTQTVSLQGKLALTTLDSKKHITLDVSLQGKTDSQGFAVLKPTGSVGVANLELAAKATCLGVDGDCSSNFVDIYVSYEDRIYHHQVESVKDTMTMPEEPKEADEPAVEPKQPGQSQDNNVADEDHEDDDDHEEENDVADEGPGAYVGDIAGDIEKVLEVKPKPKAPPQTDSPKQETPKSEVPPKKDEPKKEEPKKQDPKKPEPKKEEPKKEEPKKEEPKKDSPKPEVPPKKDEPKKDEPKQQEPKKEEPKKGDSKDDDQDEKDKEDAAKNDGPAPNAPPTFDQFVKLDQAIGPVNAGELINATDILSYQKAYPELNFRMLRTERKTYYGTIEMAYLLAKMGKYTTAIAPGHALRIKDVSKRRGGPLGSHKSHTNGRDADIAYYFKGDKAMSDFSSALKGGKPIGDWMMAQQWKLLKYTVSSKFVDRIFIHPSLKKSLCSYAQSQGEMDNDLAKETLRRLVPESNHYNHFHLRIKCSKGKTRCKQMAEPSPGTGC